MMNVINKATKQSIAALKLNDGIKRKTIKIVKNGRKKGNKT